MNEQFYRVFINPTSHKVVDWKSDVDPIGVDEIQTLVDKLIKSKMITLDTNINIVNNDGNIEVDINIWDIGEDDGELYIETFHNNPNVPYYELFDDYNGTMRYKDFLKL